MIYLDGRKWKKIFLKNFKKQIHLLEMHPCLAVLSIGNDLVENSFLKAIQSMCSMIGCELVVYHYEDLLEKDLMRLLWNVNQDSRITSVLVMLPIPNRVLLEKIKNSLSYQKDVDGITYQNQLLQIQKCGGFLPCAVLGIKLLLDCYNINIEKKHVVIMNRTERIGKPFLEFFLSQNCTVTVVHRHTTHLNDYLKKADIVVSAVGSGSIFSTKQLKEDAILFDLGMKDVNGKICGDFQIDLACKLKYVCTFRDSGAMTIVGLAQNILTSYYLNFKDSDLFL